MTHLKRPIHIAEALYVTADIKAMERQHVKGNGISMYDLMELAGEEAWKFATKHWADAKNITVLCGKGNNAGDGFVFARLAHVDGFNVQVLLSEENAHYKGDAKIAHQSMLEQGVTVDEFHSSKLSGSDLIVDALLGTGLSGELRGNFKSIIQSVNEYCDQIATPLLSLDIPSGLNADTGACADVAIVAVRTLTFIRIKAGMVTGKARAYCGEIELANLSVDESIAEQYLPTAWIDDADVLIEQLPKRSNVSHKGDHGHLLLIGGDFGFGGAILMSAMAAARSGVGLITILTRDAHVAPILTQCPEAMIRSVSGKDDPLLAQILSKVDAVVIGPGLGQEEWGIGLLEVICATNLPLLVDADALNILAKNNGDTQAIQSNNWVMTPHPGEAARLLDVSIAEIEQNRYAAIQQLQDNYSGVIVLKGAGTLIAGVQQRKTVCIEGNAGMASAGMGDILSGICGSLLAQGLTASVAARTAVALHSRAGDLAAMNGQKGLMATDLIDPLRMLVNQS